MRIAAFVRCCLRNPFSVAAEWSNKNTCTRTLCRDDTKPFGEKRKQNCYVKIYCLLNRRFSHRECIYWTQVLKKSCTALTNVFLEIISKREKCYTRPQEEQVAVQLVATSQGISIYHLIASHRCICNFNRCFSGEKCSTERLENPFAVAVGTDNPKWSQANLVS